MPVHNSHIADVLNETADLLEIKGENPFRVRAYRNAARTIESLGQAAAELIEQGKNLADLPGIGEDLAGKIEQIAKTGDFDLLTELKAQLPEELIELLAIPGLGAKRIAQIHHQLKVSSVDDLKAALDAGKIGRLEGFGKKTEQNIREELEKLSRRPPVRTLLFRAEEIAASLAAYLKKAKGVKDITLAGSFRRRRETVRDLDILATCTKDSNIMDHFVRYDNVQKVISQGRKRSTVMLRSDFHVDVRVVPEVSYGAAIIYFTGSKEHNIAIRKLGIQNDLKLNEYGLFKDRKRIAGKTETEVYKTLGLPYIAPELRENRGELEAAQKDRLPKLITLEDIKGDLHVHSTYTDGRHSIEQMARAAKKRGYPYIAIADHSRHVSVAGGMGPDAVRKQIDEIDELNEKLTGITILKGIEVDILEDGTLDLPDDVLKKLDLCVCSLHYKFNLSKQKQTDRVLRAMDNPHFNIFAHPSGRLINQREPYELDMEQIFKAAGVNGCRVELNAHPDRLDINDLHCKMAKDMGVGVVISTDAHQTEHLDYMRYGIGQARRGWLEPDDVINTRPLDSLKRLLKRS